jgi:hypothetical protein
VACVAHDRDSDGAATEGYHAGNRDRCWVEVLRSRVRALLAYCRGGKWGERVVRAGQEVLAAYRYANLIAAAIWITVDPYVPSCPTTHEEINQ